MNVEIKVRNIKVECPECGETIIRELHDDFGKFTMDITSDLVCEKCGSDIDLSINYDLVM